MELSKVGIGSIVKIEADGRIGVVLTPDSRSVGLGVLRVFTHTLSPEGNVLPELGAQLIRQSSHVILLDKLFETPTVLKTLVEIYEELDRSGRLS